MTTFLLQYRVSVSYVTWVVLTRPLHRSKMPQMDIRIIHTKVGGVGSYKYLFN